MPSDVGVASFLQPRTAMELEIAAVLKESPHDLSNDQELTEAEKKALLKLSLEEVLLHCTLLPLYPFFSLFLG